MSPSDMQTTVEEALKAVIKPAVACEVHCAFSSAELEWPFVVIEAGASEQLIPNSHFYVVPAEVTIHSTALPPDTDEAITAHKALAKSVLDVVMSGTLAQALSASVVGATPGQNRFAVRSRSHINPSIDEDTWVSGARLELICGA